MINQFGIQKRLALVLWGSVLISFVMVGAALVIYHNVTLEERALRIMQPYAQLVSVGTDTAVAFQDPHRAQEILSTLRANKHIKQAGIFLEDGRFLAGFSLESQPESRTMPSGQSGITIEHKRAVLLQELPHDALLRISMDLEQLNEQTRQIIWGFIVGVIILLLATFAQLAILQRMIVQPISNLSEAAEYVRLNVDYEHRVSAFGNDEVARLGRSFNAMMEAIQEKQGLLQRLNRELRAISECNQLLIRAEEEQELLDSICHIVCEEAGYCMAWVGYAEQDEAKTLRPVAWANQKGYLKEHHFSWADKPEGEDPSGRAIRSGSIQWIEDFAVDPTVSIWREAALVRGYQSSIALPLKDNGNTFGVLCIYADRSRAFPEEERRLLNELANDLAFGIVTLRTRAEHSRAEEQMRIAATAFQAQEGIVITDASQVILRVNRAFTEITGFTMDEVVGTKPRLSRSDLQDEAFFEAMWEVINRDGAWQGEVWYRRKNGDDFPTWLNITAVEDPQGDITHYVGTMIDITERKEAEKKIEHLAFYDPLTNLPNRKLLQDRLHHAMMGSSRSHCMGALLFIDLDNFKILNDTCGHDIGDQLLIYVAHRLATCVREGDTISRLGGDEFIVILEDLKETPSEAAAQAKFVAEKIIADLNRPYLLAGRERHSTPSIGATLFSGIDTSVDELLKQADIAMYQAKKAGRNTLRFFDPIMQASLAARAELEVALRMGVLNGEFKLHYHAQNDSQSRIIGVEALLRWQHPVRGTIQPYEFIPLAEETGFILPIGQWVLETACKQLSAWSGDSRKSQLELAVNVSAVQFRQKDFVERVKQALSNSGAPANRLKLELTESVVLNDIEDSNNKMQALKAIGVGFALDDFGTGYSSLSYLTRLPLEKLKIDRSFICNLPDSPNEAVVVQTIITLGNSLKLNVIAEGVETEAQRAFLEKYGCKVYQGYLFSRPVDLAAFEQLLENN